MQNFESPCDLHLHSSYSDGNLSPEELVRRAGSVGLCAVSITDHDTLLGQREALEAGRRCGIEVLTGVEFSIRDKTQSFHILGYLFDPDDAALAENAARLAEARVGRARRMVELLNEEGVDLEFDDIVERAGEGTIGRPHIAKALLDMGVIGEIQEAFDRYIGYGSPCYVPKTVLPLDTVIGLIENAGGVAVWAHPGQNVRKGDVLERLCRSGIVGVEVWHPNHTKEIERDILYAARERGLICTGGSDFHFSEAKQFDIGSVTVPYQAVTALRRAAEARNP